MTNLKKIYCALIFCAFFTACSVNKANVDDSLKSHFDPYNATGSFTLYNNATGEVTVYNLEADTTRFSSGSSFNTFLALVSLQSGALATEHSLVHLDSLSAIQNACGQNIALQAALKSDCRAFFDEMMVRNGKKIIQYWVDTVGYGDKQLKTSGDSILVAPPSISSDEQLGLMKRLYFGLLPFRKSVQSQIKQLMMVEDKTLYKLSFLHSTAVSSENKPMEWLTGWIEENNHVYFFVTLVKRNDMNSGKCAEQITRSILKQYDFFNGKK